MKNFLSMWGWPLLLGVLTASGLLSALLSDGVGDVWSWFALGLPVAVAAWFGFVRSRHLKRDRHQQSTSEGDTSG